MSSQKSKYKFELGDKVVCVPGYSDSTHDRYAGSGYVLDKILTVTQIIEGITASSNYYYFDEINHGVKECALITLEKHRENKIKYILDER